MRYTNNQHTLFDFVASAIGVDDDVNSRTTAIALSETRLRTPRNGSREGPREADVTFQIEVPKGITFSLDAAYLEPGKAYFDVITKRAWAFSIGVSLSL